MSMHKRALTCLAGLNANVGAPSKEPFHCGIRPGETVKYQAYAGMGLKGPEYKLKSGRAVMVFPDRIVLNGGGRHGIPVVVTAANFSGPG